MTFGDVLRQRRRALDLTRAELAEAVGCSVSALRKFEAGDLRPSRPLAEVLAGVLQIAPEERAAFVRFARDRLGADTTRVAVPTVSLQSPAPPTTVCAMLPVPLTPLIGRAREVAAVCTALEDRAVRMLTLTGPGGIGKTRLALQVAAELEPAFADGVVFVDLAPIREVSLVLTTIAEALGLPDADRGTLLARLQTALRQRQMLLLLDNFEQVVAAAPVVGELLAAAPRVRVLLTSRVVVGVYGEHDFPVPPLPLPNLSDLPPVDRLMQVETVRLFVERARAARPDFSLTGENAHAVSELCHQLDGVPLAIELAAARVRRLSPGVLLQRFGEGMPGRLEVLTGGPRTVPARQQTVRATIAWSYDLLTPRAQQLFRRLGVFVGGGTREAAEAVCGWDDAAHLEASLEALLDTSLLQQRERVEGEVRVMMLETVRDYALEQLAASGELEEMQRRHADYFVMLAEGAEPIVRGPRRLWWDRLEAEHDNMRAVLAWSRTEPSGVSGLRLAVALAGFWQRRGHMSEGYGWLTSAVAQREVDVSVAPSRRSYHRLRAYALDALGVFARFLGAPDDIQALFEESLALFQTLDDRAGRLEVLGDLGMLLVQRGAFGRGQVVLEEGLALARELGQGSAIAESLFYLGHLRYAQGDAGRASELWEEGVHLVRPTEDPLCYTMLLVRLSVVALDQGDYERAGAHLAESLRLLREQGDRLAIIQALEMRARLAAESSSGLETGQRGLVRAARLFGATEAIRERLAFPILSEERRSYEHGLATLRARLKDEPLAAAWAEGRALTLEQAIAHALGDGFQESEIPEES